MPSSQPQPLVLPAYPEFLGDWSQVAVGIGTPPQWLAMLPSTVGSELWAITPEGCPEPTLSLIPNCSETRGGLFYSNESSTLTVDSTETIPDTEFFFPAVGSYILDTVTLNATNSSGTSLLPFTHQTIAEFNGSSFWWGMLGLGQKTVALADPENHPSLLTSLKGQNAIPSISYGFTAGAAYANYLANLVLGGYDSAAFQANNVTFDVNDSSGDRALTLSIQSIEVANTLTGTLSIPIPSNEGIGVAIDSMLPHLWLPQDICDSLADALGLWYDNSTGLYLANNTDSLRNLNPQFAFKLAANGTSTETVTINFDYDAFDRTQGPPIYNESLPMFPIRRAVNDSQSVLGRAFLQEAYVVVDWERGNFSVNQATHVSSNTTGDDSGIVAIISPGETASSTSSSGLSGGAIAGIVIGVVAAVLLVVGGFFFWRRRTAKRRAAAQPPRPEMKEDPVPLGPPPAEIMSHTVHEVGTENERLEKSGDEWDPDEKKDRALPRTPTAELESPSARHELEA